MSPIIQPESLVRRTCHEKHRSTSRKREPLLSTLSSSVIDQITDKKLPVDFSENHCPWSHDRGARSDKVARARSTEGSNDDRGNGSSIRALLIDSREPFTLRSNLLSGISTRTTPETTVRKSRNLLNREDSTFERREREREKRVRCLAFSSVFHVFSRAFFHGTSSSGSF